MTMTSLLMMNLILISNQFNEKISMKIPYNPKG